MRKKSFRKTISLVLCTAMSVTMTGTPVLADPFTDGSQLIVSEDAGEETPAAAISDAEDGGMMEPEHTFEIEDNSEDSGYAGFSGENETSEFSDDNVLAAQTEGKEAVYLDPILGDNNNTGESDTAAVKTLSKALGLVAQGGDIFLLDRVEVDSDITLSNVTFRPGRSNMSGMLYIRRGDVTLEKIIINNITPDGTPCQFSYDPIRVTGTLTIEDGTKIGPFPGKSCIIVSQRSTVNLNGGEILGDKQNTIKYGGGICAIEYSNVWLKGGSIAGNKSGQGSGVYLDMSNLFMKEENGKSCQITQNTVTTEPSPKDMHGEGGGIFLIYSEAEIESGTIKKIQPLQLLTNTVISGAD